MRLTLLHFMRLAFVFVCGVSLSSAFNYLVISNNYFSNSLYVAGGDVAPSARDALEAPEPPHAESQGFFSNNAIALPVSEDQALEVAPAKGGLLREVKTAARKGDTLLSFLRRGGISSGEAMEISGALRKIMDASSIKTGQRLEVTLEHSAEYPEQQTFRELKMIYPERLIQVMRKADKTLDTQMIAKPLTKKTVRAGGAIHNSLMGVAEDIGIPGGVMQAVINAYSYDVDFQRDIQDGDRFEVMYESMQDEKGHHVRSGNVLYAQLLLSGKPLRIYYYADSSGEGGFYTEDGKSVKKALLRTPVNGARITSGFGMRMHPVLGYSKMHRGVDFGAPVGTPIYAAGDGRVAEAGPKGTYGNYVRIRHNGEYSTAYAHTSHFAAGIRPGVKVKQGQVIAYVGTTGRSTGPHLHFEVLKGDAQINPMQVKTMATAALSRRDLARFKRQQERLRMAAADLPMQSQLASAK